MKRMGALCSPTNQGRQVTAKLAAGKLPEGQNPFGDGTAAERAVARRAEELGAGELFLNSIQRDGTMSGYDLDLIAEVSASVQIPVIACGGAGSLDDLATVTRRGGASAAAAGSLFVFHGKYRAVLISYPPPQTVDQILT